MKRLLVLLLMLMPCAADAIVIRHDVNDSMYRVAASEFPALVDLPGEGHGVLIAPRWVVTAAHAVSWQSAVTCVTINGLARNVKRLVIYPGYKKLPQELIQQSLATGDATPTTKFLAASNDIALIELAAPVADVAPAIIYTGNAEPGAFVEIIGKGATGTGLTGQLPGAPHRGDLRRAFSRITSVEERWVGLTFAKPPAAQSLEGITGDGDSGSPVLLDVGNQKHVVGLTSWKSVSGDARVFRPGLYGQTVYSVRLSHYGDWIKSVMTANN